MRNSVLWPALGSMAAYDFPVIAAATDEPLPAAVQERLEALERKVRTLERQLEVEQETKAADKAKQTATISAGADGFALKSTDGAFQLKLRGLLHADSRWFFEGGGGGTAASPRDWEDEQVLLSRLQLYF
jgi:hypothetical protein